MDYSKEKGLEKNNVVIYTSDQEFYLGEHGCFDNRFMYEQSFRTPLIVSWPDVIEPGSITNDMLKNPDLGKTL